MSVNDAGGLTEGDPPAGWVPALVGVGGAGVRFRSINGGLSWPFEARLAPSGGDDENLLRAVAYGKGIWITGGWQYFTSTDAKTWTKRTHPCGGAVVEGLAFGAGRFIAACGDTTFSSTDGLDWTRGGRSPAAAIRRSFMRQAYSSRDGANWTQLPGVQDVAACNGAIKSRSQCFNAIQLQGAYFRGYAPELGGDGVHRSVDGKVWTAVHPIGVNAFASGFVPGQ